MTDSLKKLTSILTDRCDTTAAAGYSSKTEPCDGYVAEYNSLKLERHLICYGCRLTEHIKKKCPNPRSGRKQKTNGSPASR